jgi:hypothetical protein
LRMNPTGGFHTQELLGLRSGIKRSGGSFFVKYLNLKIADPKIPFTSAIEPRFTAAELSTTS